MIDRRQLIPLAFAALGAACLAPAARTQQGFARFTGFLVDLPGWKGNKPDGMAMELAGSSMVTATRGYERGSAKVNASVLTGAPALPPEELVSQYVSNSLQTGDNVCDH